jgi:hypothetical protein
MITIDVAYKLGSNSDWGNYEELRYSIRSLQKNFKNLGNIFIVGSSPDWACNGYFHALNDPYRTNKDANLINKLIVAAKIPLISDYFLNMSDDYFLTKPLEITDETQLKVPYFDNSVPQPKEERPNRWNKRLRRTFDHLDKLGLKSNCYEIHAPQLLNKKLFPDTVLRYPFGEDIGMCGNTLYFNTVEQKGEVLGKQVPENYVGRVKNKTQKIPKNCTWINTTPKGMGDNIKDYLQKEFSEKSDYEKEFS